MGGARPFLRAWVHPFPHPFPPGAPLVHRRRTPSRHSNRLLRGRSAPTVATNPLLPPRALTRTAHPFPHPFPPGAPLVHRRRTPSRHSNRLLRGRSAPTVATNPLLPPRALTRTAHPFPHPFPPGAPLVHRRRTHFRHSHQRLRARSAPTVATNPHQPTTPAPRHHPHGAPVSAPVSARRTTRSPAAHPFAPFAPAVTGAIGAYGRGAGQHWY